MSNNFPQQNAGANEMIAPVLPEPQLKLELEMITLMDAIDMIDMDRDTSQYGKVSVEVYTLPRPTYDFYMKWLAQGWYYHGLTLFPEHVITSLQMFAVTCCRLRRV